jgi:predicted signal transduction protein with EAL and GGDEF domain
MNASISASFGVTSTTLSGYDLRQLLAHADRSLYQSKRTGRNRITLFDAARMDDVATAIPEHERRADSAAEVAVQQIRGCA